MLRSAIVALLAALVLPAAAQETAKPFLHPLFSSNMVLQRDIAAPVWGWTEPGAEVTVSVAGLTATATAGADGKWLARVGPLSAGGPHEMTVTGGGQSATLRSVLVGDVWICSGQSNMQWPVAAVNNAGGEIADAGHPTIRLFTVPNVTAFEPRELVQGTWSQCNPSSVGYFTAVGYFFGRTLAQRLNVPIGLINTSWGGTIAEAWTSGEALKADMPDFVEAVAQVERTAEELRTGQTDYSAKLAAWYRDNDPGSAETGGYADPATDTSGWPEANVPANWEDTGLPGFDGIAWYVREVELAADWAGSAAVLRLAAIDDRDTTFVNGVEVGSKEAWNESREYAVPAGVLRAGRNVIAIRVLDTGGGGGIHGEAGDLKLERTGAEAIGLAGTWRLKSTKPLAETTPPPARADSNPNIATVLYNAMISPLVPFGVKGAIWYQGESNADRAEQYSRLLPTLIRDWRTRFEVGEFPFYIVELANFMAQDTEPKNDAWPNLRESQWNAAARAGNADVASIIDIGDANDIHPRNKQDVGLRLALLALAETYGEAVECSGPRYRSLAVEGDRVRLSFDHTTGGLGVKGGGKLTGFAIAGADGKFVWAEAEIDGDTVVVHAAGVTAPTAVRYAWGNNPVCNLTNGTGLPAPPFRTDGPQP